MVSTWYGGLLLNVYFNSTLTVLGLCTDGVYKVPGVKSKVQSLKIQYNRRQSVNLADYDLAVVTSLLKQYLRYCASVCVFFSKFFCILQTYLIVISIENFLIRF